MELKRSARRRGGVDDKVGYEVKLCIKVKGPGRRLRRGDQLLRCVYSHVRKSGILIIISFSSRRSFAFASLNASRATLDPT